MLELHRRQVGLRKATPALRAGSWTAVPAPASVVAYDRELGDDHVRVLLNLAHAPVRVPLAGRGRRSTGTGRRSTGRQAGR